MLKKSGGDDTKVEMDTDTDNEFEHTSTTRSSARGSEKVQSQSNKKDNITDISSSHYHCLYCHKDLSQQHGASKRLLHLHRCAIENHVIRGIAELYNDKLLTGVPQHEIDNFIEKHDKKKKRNIDTSSKGNLVNKKKKSKQTYDGGSGSGTALRSSVLARNDENNQHQNSITSSKSSDTYKSISGFTSTSVSIQLTLYGTAASSSLSSAQHEVASLTSDEWQHQHQIFLFAGSIPTKHLHTDPQQHKRANNSSNHKRHQKEQYDDISTSHSSSSSSSLSTTSTIDYSRRIRNAVCNIDQQLYKLQQQRDKMMRQLKQLHYRFHSPVGGDTNANADTINDTETHDTVHADDMELPPKVTAPVHRSRLLSSSLRNVNNTFSDVPIDRWRVSSQDADIQSCVSIQECEQSEHAVKAMLELEEQQLQLQRQPSLAMQTDGSSFTTPQPGLTANYEIDTRALARAADDSRNDKLDALVAIFTQPTHPPAPSQSSSIDIHKHQSTEAREDAKNGAHEQTADDITQNEQRAQRYYPWTTNAGEAATSKMNDNDPLTLVTLVESQDEDEPDESNTHAPDCTPVEDDAVEHHPAATNLTDDTLEDVALVDYENTRDSIHDHDHDHNDTDTDADNIVIPSDSVEVDNAISHYPQHGLSFLFTQPTASAYASSIYSAERVPTLHLQPTSATHEDGSISVSMPHREDNHGTSTSTVALYLDGGTNRLRDRNSIPPLQHSTQGCTDTPKIDNSMSTAVEVEADDAHDYKLRVIVSNVTDHSNASRSLSHQGDDSDVICIANPLETVACRQSHSTISQAEAKQYDTVSDDYADGMEVPMDVDNDNAFIEDVYGPVDNRIVNDNAIDIHDGSHLYYKQQSQVESDEEYARRLSSPINNDGDDAAQLMNEDSTASTVIHDSEEFQHYEPISASASNSRCKSSSGSIMKHGSLIGSDGRDDQCHCKCQRGLTIDELKNWSDERLKRRASNFGLRTLSRPQMIRRLNTITIRMCLLQSISLRCECQCHQNLDQHTSNLSGSQSATTSPVKIENKKDVTKRETSLAKPLTQSAPPKSSPSTTQPRGEKRKTNTKSASPLQLDEGCDENIRINNNINVTLNNHDDTGSAVNDSSLLQRSYSQPLTTDIAVKNKTNRNNNGKTANRMPSVNGVDNRKDSISNVDTNAALIRAFIRSHEDIYVQVLLLQPLDIRVLIEAMEREVYKRLHWQTVQRILDMEGINSQYNDGKAGAMNLQGSRIPRDQQRRHRNSNQKYS